MPAARARARARTENRPVHQHHHAGVAPVTETVAGFIAKLFDTDFMRRGDCVAWRPEIVWLHIVSDAMIALSYYSIPIALIYFVRQRRDLAFSWMFVCFATFILACGTTHVFGIIAFWEPMYRADGVVKLGTGLVSMITAVLLWRLMPAAVALPSPSQLREANAALSRARDELEHRVAERTAELRGLNERLESQIAQTRRISEECRESEARFRLALSDSRVVVFSQDLHGRYIWSHNAWLGRGPDRLVGRTDEEVFGPADAMLLSELRRMVIESGERITREITLGAAPDQSHYLLTLDPVRSDDGEIVGVTGAAVNITERKAWERHQALLVAELDHRVKNNLANVLALAEQSLSRSGDLSSFSESYTARIRAMARTHEALAKGKWRGSTLSRIVHGALEPYILEDSARLVVRGDDVTITTRSASALSMALSELTTNAAKYGSLSVPHGRVEVSWTVYLDQAQRTRVHMIWQEHGGPPVTPPTRRGLGSELIEGGIRYELQGKVELQYHADGLRCEIDFAVDRPGSASIGGGSADASTIAPEQGA